MQSVNSRFKYYSAVRMELRKVTLSVAVAFTVFTGSSQVIAQEVTFSATQQQVDKELLSSPPAVSAPAPVARQSVSGLTSELVLSLYKSGILELRKSPSRVSIGNDSIADILILRGNQVHVLGKALGSTNVVFWDSADRIFATVNIEVTHDLAALKKKLFQMMPSENIRMYSAQENIVLEGPVSSSSNLTAAIKVAEAYLPECISSGSGNKQSGGGGEAKANEESCKKAEVVNLCLLYTSPSPRDS